MAYKDKDRQREANAERQRRYKAKHKALPKGVTSEGVTIGALPNETTDISAVKALHRLIGPERTAQGNIWLSKPGDDDYVPMCRTTKAFVDGKDKRPCIAKRGIIIKSFEDLPPDVQKSIDRMSVFNGKIDRAIKIKRTEAAIRYQHLFPDRYHSTQQPLMMSKPT